MGTFDNWLEDLAEIGPLYPLVGSEGFWVAVVAFFWIFEQILRFLTRF